MKAKIRKAGRPKADEPLERLGLNLRIPRGMRGEMEKAARRDGRSLASWCAVVLCKCALTEYRT